MKNTHRLVVLLILLALVLHNLISSRMLNLALESLRQGEEEHTSMVSQDVSEDLTRSWSSSADRLQLLSSLVKTHHLEGLAVYEGSRLLSIYPPSPPEPLTGIIQDLAGSTEPENTDRTSRYFVRSRAVQLETGKHRMILIFQGERAFQMERSAKILGILNLLILGFAALLGFYFIEITLRPFRILLQTAKSAEADLPVNSGRNEADFLIGTFKGVIAKLKEKEQELGKLHLAEKARADQVQQLNQDLLQSISSGLILIGLNGSIEVFNHAAQSILETSPLQAIHQPYAPIVDNISTTFRQDIDVCFHEHSATNRAEMEISTAQGNVRFLSTNVMPLRDRQKNFSGVFCLFTDITDFKLLQLHLSQKEKFASLGEMAAGVAHEFRNSLATMTGYLQMAENKIQPDQTTYIKPIQKELNLLQKVVNDFLSFARPMPLDVTRVDLRELLRECVEEVNVANRRSVQFSIKGEFPEIPGDEVMLRQVFTNLLKNSVESFNNSPQNGQVDVSGFLSPQQKFSVIEIRDNGPGIPPENLNRIFNPFFSTKEDGVGLGLAIVQKLILQHNGTISVSSSESGTVFRAQLPLQQDALPSPA